MARKRLIKGTNAQRVEKRIAKVPEDITETSIFKVLKEIEEKSRASQRSSPEIPRQEKPKAQSLKNARPKTKNPKREKPKAKKTKKQRIKNKRPKIEEQKNKKTIERKTQKLQSSYLKTSPAALTTAKTTSEKLREEREGVGITSKTSIKFTRAEKEIVLKSCKSYRNTLPIYLKSVQKEVKTIDSIIKKLTRSKKG